MSKQHGMLFADELMPPLLDGRKVQTRRPLSKQPRQRHDGSWELSIGRSRSTTNWRRRMVYSEATGALEADEHFQLPVGEWLLGRSLYHVGDLIWARECWGWGTCGKYSCVKYRADNAAFLTLADQGGEGDIIALDAPCVADVWPDDCPQRWKPSIHMPKWACRCWLEITDVRVQRVNDISEADAMAEGVEKQFRVSVAGSAVAHIPNSYRGGFANAWNKIYPGSWDRNGWVWALTFKRVDRPSPAGPEKKF